MAFSPRPQDDGPFTHQDLQDHLGDRDRKLIKKTRAQTEAIRLNDGSIAIRLYDTYIMTAHPDGTYTIDTGGWRTMLTKARLNEYLPDMHIDSKNGLWTLRFAGRTVYFFEGMHVDPDRGLVLNDDGGEAEELAALKREINAYAKEIARRWDDRECHFGDSKWFRIAITARLEPDEKVAEHIMLELEHPRYPAELVAGAILVSQDLRGRWSLYDIMRARRLFRGDLARKDVRRWMKRVVGLA